MRRDKIREVVGQGVCNRCGVPLLVGDTVLLSDSPLAALSDALSAERIAADGIPTGLMLVMWCSEKCAADNGPGFRSAAVEKGGAR